MDVRRGKMLRPDEGLSPDLGRIILEDCDPDVAVGIRKWASELTRRHSITSRRYSMTTGFGRHVDNHISRVFDEFRPVVGRNLAQLEGFKLSQAWRHTSTRREVHHPTPLSQAVASSTGWKDRINGAIFGFDYGAHFERAQVHDELAFEGPRSAAAGQLTLYMHVEFRRLFHTLRTIERVIDWCNEQKPQSSADYSSLTNRIRNYPTRDFCELCWRHPELHVARKAKEYASRPARGRLHPYWDTPEQRQKFAELDRYEQENSLIAASLPIRPSRELCHLHRRGSKLYWSDTKYSQQFRDEMIYLQNRAHVDAPLIAWDQDPLSRWGMRFVVVPETAHLEDIRRAAYAKVHCGMQGLRAHVAYMFAKGHTLPEIAKLSGHPVRTVQDNFKKVLGDLEYIRLTSRANGTEYPYRKDEKKPLTAEEAHDLLRESVRAAHVSAASTA